MFWKILPMTGFEPGSSGVGIDHATNCATTTAHFLSNYELKASNFDFVSTKVKEVKQILIDASVVVIRRFHHIYFGSIYHNWQPK